MIFPCGKCGFEIKISQNQLGRVVGCPKCGVKIKTVDKNRKISKTFKKLDKKVAEELDKVLRFKPKG